MTAKLTRAQDFLRTQLAHGPVGVPRLRQEAASIGVSWRTIETAKAQLSVKSTKSGGKGPWVWSLPVTTETPFAHLLKVLDLTLEDLPDGWEKMGPRQALFVVLRTKADLRAC